jgi:hypothetical protein
MVKNQVSGWGCQLLQPYGLQSHKKRRLNSKFVDWLNSREMRQAPYPHLPQTHFKAQVNQLKTGSSVIFSNTVASLLSPGEASANFQKVKNTDMELSVFPVVPKLVIQSKYLIAMTKI